MEGDLWMFDAGEGTQIQVMLQPLGETVRPGVGMGMQNSGGGGYERYGQVGGRGITCEGESCGVFFP